jgi:secreted trypsin-like serine protease
MKNSKMSKLFAFSSLILITAFASAANAQTQRKFKNFIVGGTAVSADDPIAATTVFISGQEDEGTYFCSGSLIDQDMVVTAAHCVQGAIDGSLRVIFTQKVSFDDQGLPTLTDASPEVHQVYGAIFNPQYDPNYTGVDQHDIAIIRFKSGLPTGYKTATMLNASVNLTAGETTTLAGYGTTQPDGSDSGGELRKVDVQIASMLGKTEVVLDQSQGKGACFGDSGGPAFITTSGQLLLWGLTNRAYPDDVSDCAHESVYTRITAYSDFVSSSEATLKQMN